MPSDASVLPGGVVMRPAAATDAEALLAAYLHNREHLRPWDSLREADFFTIEGQRARLMGQLAEREAGRLLLWVLTDGPRIVGVITLSGIRHGPSCSGNLGYWIDVDHAGKGLASAAVEAVARYADEEAGLHRLEAGTLLHNAGSQRVLEKCGFEPYGVAPRYLHINGEWQDMRLFQRILNDRPPAGA
ncbi:GNAT family N-acetyltransferase [Streptomyces ochraceiscleroticus]|uniref:GNAT family N-acetyltransferase n=1 Tax=Streptomyces ochraceiscleroticus TaxID=47761 RepID=A0ABW1MJ96_9ACTN|nr:GNAT family protein [Streptomyces ochraceiscleroticus]